MNSLDNYIIEKLNRNSRSTKYYPETKEDLIILINEHFEKRIFDLNDIDTSRITDMSKLFSLTEGYMLGWNYRLRLNVSEWDVSNVTNMSSLFYPFGFGGDLSKWDVSNVTNMSNMFRNNNAFDGDLSKWDVSNVTNMSYMFYNSIFRGDISNWNVSKGTKTTNMFKNSPLDGNEPDWYNK